MDAGRFRRARARRREDETRLERGGRYAGDRLASRVPWSGWGARESLPGHPSPGRRTGPRHGPILSPSPSVVAPARVASRGHPGLSRTIPVKTFVTIRVPPLSRRAKGLGKVAFHRPRHDRPIHILVDSTGVKVHSGNMRKPPKNRAWRKLHLVVDANTGDVAACDLGSSQARDAARVPALLKQVERPPAWVAADSAYDTEGVYAAKSDTVRAARHGCSYHRRRTRSSAGILELQRAQSQHQIANEPRKAHVAHLVRLQQAKSGRNHDVSVQDHHRSDGPGPNAARSEGGSQSGLPDLEPHDVPGNAREFSSGLSAGRAAGDAGSQWSRASRPRWPGLRSGRGWGSRLPPVMMESRVDTQARRPSLASVVGTRERERREIPHDVSSDPARQWLHLDPAKPCLGRAGRECPGSRRRRLEADVGDVPGRVPVRRCDRESRIPGSSRMIPAYPGLKLLIDLTVRAPGGRVVPGTANRQAVDEMVQGAPHVMHRVAGDQRPLQQRRRLRDSDGEAMTGELRVRVSDESIRAMVKPGADLSLDGLHMFFGAPEFCPTALEVFEGAHG